MGETKLMRDWPAARALTTVVGLGVAFACRSQQRPPHTCAELGPSGCQPPAAPASSPAAVANAKAAKSDAPPLALPGPSPLQPQPDEAAHPVACPNSVCIEYPSAASALTAAVTTQVRVVGFGEAHAPAGLRGPSTVRRFTEDLLPTLAPRAQALIVELLAAPSGCEPARQRVQEESEQVTEGQAATNQGEYVALGHQAKKLGVIPDILRPTCEQMRTVAEAELGVLAMMELIAELAGDNALSASGRTTVERPLVLLYGGALHNDVSPRAGLESWSYGTRLAEKLGAAYLELDLVLPELLRDTESWRKFPWYSDVAALPQGHGTVLVQVSAGSAALVLPQRQRDGTGLASEQELLEKAQTHQQN